MSYIYIYIFIPLKFLSSSERRYAKSHMNLRIPWHAGHGRAAKGQVRGSPLACATNTWEVGSFFNPQQPWIGEWSETTGICGGRRFFEESYRRYKHIQVVPLYILFTQKRSIAFKHMQSSEMPDSDSTKRIATDCLRNYHVFSVWLAWRPLLLFQLPPTYMPLKGS